jgi:predicted small lipoprotein YifL
MTAGRILMTGVLLMVLGAAAGCGRKAPLDSPYEAAVEARRQAAENDEPLPPEPEPPVADRPFILDGLID